MRVLITGANRGVGAALLRAYGDSAMGTSRAGGDLLPLDVTDRRSIDALVQRMSDHPVTTLICNAGVLHDKFLGVDDAAHNTQLWTDTFAVNVTGVFETIQAFLPQLRAADDAKIAIISSQMGSNTIAKGNSLAYRASKAAALNLGRNLAVELAGDGIAVGIYHPGWVRTDMGGDEADISVTESAQGLKSRIDALSLATSGCFETWDGKPHPL